MQHYYSPLYRQVADPVESPSQPGAPSEVRRERVPALIDALDCLLALWVAEATLDAEPRHDERPQRSLTGTPIRQWRAQG
jgi:hypothetical protein